MACCYAIFLVTPMFLAIGVSLRGRRDDFREMALAVMLQMWIAFFIFICLPAGPPRYFAPLRDGVFRTPLPSFFGFNYALQAHWDTYSPLLVRASFPSLHCAYATLDPGLRLALRRRVFRGRAARLLLHGAAARAVAVLSTVYLRHHWIPDIARRHHAGLLVCSAAPWLRARWPEMERSSPVGRRGGSRKSADRPRGGGTRPATVLGRVGFAGGVLGVAAAAVRGVGAAGAGHLDAVGLAGRAAGPAAAGEAARRRAAVADREARVAHAARDV